MIAAIVSGVLAIVGTIVGGVIAGYSASSTVAQQLTGETQKSQAEFRRSQQQKAYADGATHAAQLHAAEHALHAELLIRNGPARTVALDKMNAAAGVMEAHEGLINLVGSEATRTKWAEMIARHGELRLWLYKYSQAVAAGANIKEFTEERFINLIAAAASAEDAYAEQARVDLGYK